MLEAIVFRASAHPFADMTFGGHFRDHVPKMVPTLDRWRCTAPFVNDAVSVNVEKLMPSRDRLLHKRIQPQACLTRHKRRDCDIICSRRTLKTVSIPNNQPVQLFTQMCHVEHIKPVVVQHVVELIRCGCEDDPRQRRSLAKFSPCLKHAYSKDFHFLRIFCENIAKIF